MAWCPHCKEDRPIQRQSFDGECEYCGRMKGSSHKEGCRGPVEGALDVCSYCHTPVFAKASTEEDYEELAAVEGKIDKSKCFVATATLGETDHPIVTDLQKFRDKVLLHNPYGIHLVKGYYKWGPLLAKRIEAKGILRGMSRWLLVLPAHQVAKLFLWKVKYSNRDDKHNK